MIHSFFLRKIFRPSISLVLIVIDVDVSVSIATDVADAADIRVFLQFLLVVVGGWIAARTIVAESRDVAAHLRPPAADQHQERLAATGALLLRLTCVRTQRGKISSVRVDSNKYKQPNKQSKKWLNRFLPPPILWYIKVPQSLLDSVERGKGWATEFELVQVRRYFLFCSV